MTTAQLRLPDCAAACQALVRENAPRCSYDQVFRSRLTRCVQGTCPTLENTLQWQTAYAAACNLPARDQGVKEVVLACVLFGTATFTLVGRLLSRAQFMGGPGFWWDDCVATVLWILSVELVVCLIFLRANWVGRDAIEWVSREHIKNVLLWVYISEPFYIVVTYGSKLVWVLLYLRMWDSNTCFRKLCWFTVALMAAGMIGFGVAAIATVWPHHLYIGRSAMVQTHRLGIDLIPAVLSIGVLNAASDFWVLLLPITKLMSLRGVTKQRRTGICIIFLLGFIVTACSIVRLTTIIPLRNSTNATRDFGHFGTWSEIEVHLSMVSCNLPALVGLVHRLKWRYRKRNPAPMKEEPQQTAKTRSNAPKDATSTTEESSTIDDGLFEHSNGNIMLTHTPFQPPD